MDTTLDGLLDRRVALEQPAKGYRVAVDTVLLAASVPAHAGESALDLGCGVGGAMLCLACRVLGISVTGVEIRPELLDIASRNIARNAFQAEMKILQGDATRLPETFAGAFDHVLMNPPYHDESTHDISPDALKRAANTEKEGDLALWLASAAEALRAQGTLTLIHRADRLEEILALAAAQGFGGMSVLSVLARPDDSGQTDRQRRGRFLLRAYKDGIPREIRQCRDLVMHQAGGGYSDDAAGILRHMQPVDFA